MSIFPTEFCSHLRIISAKRVHLLCSIHWLCLLTVTSQPWPWSCCGSCTPWWFYFQCTRLTLTKALPVWPHQLIHCSCAFVTAHCSSENRDHCFDWIWCPVTFKSWHHSTCLLCLCHTRTPLHKWLCQQCQLYMDQLLGGCWGGLLGFCWEDNLDSERIRSDNVRDDGRCSDCCMF